MKLKQTASKANNNQSEQKDPYDLGYLKDFQQAYSIGKKLGRGGNGTVFVAARRSDGVEFAVKIIPKVLLDPCASERKKSMQLPSIRREVEVLLALRGSLSVARLEGAYEDSRNVYLVLELCRGGELLGSSTLKSGSKKPMHTYSERVVASYLRSILQTIAQCHARSIIHRDIKPENFLLLTKEENSPIKAIDFGLATFFTPDTLPLTAPNAEGTPWYLAPEACRGKWWPVTDIWATGIMAAYMLTGVYPFIDRTTPNTPDLARTLKVICSEELNVTGSEWAGLSTEAIQFVKYLLVKDPAERPSAVDALGHPFLHDHPTKADRPLHHSVVQRIQRFAQNGVFKRRVLEHIARDLVQMHFGDQKRRSEHGNGVMRDRSMRAARAYQEATTMTMQRDPSGSYRYRSLPKDPSGSYRYSMALARTMSRKPSYGAMASLASQDMMMTSAASARREGSRHSGTTLQPPGGIGGSMHSNKSGESALSSTVVSVPAGVYLPVSTPYSRRLAVLLDTLDADSSGTIDRDELQEALQKMGYHIDDQEASELFDAVDVDRTGTVLKEDISASLVDWKWVQDTFADRWVDSVRRVFQDLDKDGDGFLGASEIAAAFSGHLDTYEVDAAVHEALLEAVGPEIDQEDGQDGTENNKGKEEATIDFQHLLKLLQATPVEDLGLFDDRLSVHSSRYPSVNLDDELAPSPSKGGLAALFGCCGGSA